MRETLRIGIVGDFHPEFRSHPATGASLDHAARALSMSVDWGWLPTPSLAGPQGEKSLEGYHGLWISAGSPYESFDGALAAIRFARTRDWPLVAT